MAPDMDPQKKNLIIYDMNSGTKFTLTAAKSSMREQWLSHTQKLIQVHNAIHTLSLVVMDINESFGNGDIKLFC